MGIEGRHKSGEGGNSSGEGGGGKQDKGKLAERR